MVLFAAISQVSAQAVPYMSFYYGKSDGFYYNVPNLPNPNGIGTNTYSFPLDQKKLRKFKY